MSQNLYLLNEPHKWRAGFIGAERKEFFFDCGYCEAKEPVIVGFVASEPSFDAIAVLKIDGSSFVKLALICEACIEAQKARLLGKGEDRWDS
jgi:hypothetical protein